MTTNPHGPDIILIGCGQQKLNWAANAEDMYVSQFFAAKRHYSKSSGCPWMIVSARYGLLFPKQPIEPYNLSLAGAGKHYHDIWSRLVAIQWRGLEFEPAPLVEIHAGAVYRGCLYEAIRRSSPRAEFLAPTDGMGIGRQLAWYKERRVA